MNRRRIAIGVSSVSGLAVIAVSVMNMFSSGNPANAVDLHTTPIAAVTAAGGATERAGSAQVDSLLTMSTPAVPAAGKKPAVPAKTATMHGTGQYDFGKQSGAINVALGNGALEEVLTPAALYMRSAAAPTAATPAKPWTRVEADKSSDGNLVSGGAISPALAFAMLAAAEPGVKSVGQDKVRGVPVAHYQGTLDLQQAASAPDSALNSALNPAAAGTASKGLRPEDAAAVKKALANAARAFATTKVPFDAYLDEQGRLRRFVAEFSFVAPGPAKSVVQVTSATELFGFGMPVAVATPVASQIATPAAAPASTPASTAPSAHPSSPLGTHK